MQSGRAVGVLRTHEEAPRVLIANSNLVPHWATWEKFHELEAAGLMMYGQMTAGSWIYIGSQGILQGTYETFMSAARLHYGQGGDSTPTLRGRLVLSAGLGGMGGAQPLAVTMAGGVFIGVDVDPDRIRRRIEHRYLDEMAPDLDSALRHADEYRKRGDARSIGVVGNAAAIFSELVRRGVVPDLVTDQTSAHDPLGGYVPLDLTLEGADELRRRDPDEYIRRARASMAVHCQAMLDFQREGAHVFDYGNNLRGQAELGGLEGAFSYPGFVPAYIRPLFCRGKGPSAGSRCRAIRRTSGSPTRRCSTSCATIRHCTTGCAWRRSGSPSRACRRASAGSATATATGSACASTSWWRRAR